VYIYKVAAVGSVSFAISPLTGIFNMVSTAGVFIAVAAAIISIQIISAKLPQWLSQKRQGIRHLDEQTKAAMKKQNKTTTIMVVVFVIMGLTVPTLLGLY
jgi:membrane protein insertase Oxa1/YidC/SpoIIIJ